MFKFISNFKNFFFSLDKKISLKVYISLLFSFLKVIFDLIAFLFLGLIVTSLLEPQAIEKNNFLSIIVKNNLFNFEQTLINFFFITVLIKITFDYFRSFFINKTAFEIWKKIIHIMILNISKSFIQRDKLFKLEAILLTESLNVIWNFFIPIILIVSEVLLLSIIIFILIFYIKLKFLFLLPILIVAILFVKFINLKVSRYSEEVVFTRSILGRNTNSLLSSLPDLIFTNLFFFKSNLKKNIDKFSKSYENLFFQKEFFSYVVENAYLIFILLILFFNSIFNFTENNSLNSFLIFILVILLRLMPSINRILSQIGLLTYGLSSLLEVSRFMRKVNNLTKIKNTNEPVVSISFVNQNFFKKIKFKKRYLFYPGINILNGANGSGKSTLLQAIFGVNLGKKILVRRPLELGYLSQNSVCICEIVAQEISFVDDSLSKKPISKKIFKILKESKIRLSDKIDNLSGGQRQILAFCRIISQNPNVILLDEPLASLDKRNIQNVLEILDMWVKQKKFIIVSDHTGLIKSNLIIKI